MSRILIVEDEAHIARGLAFNLVAEGHEVELASDGETGLQRLVENNENFDLLVLDVMLPGKDGFTVASELRSHKNYIPILMLTARGRPEDVLKGFAAGADDYLPKPFELAILLARLQGLLRRSQWARTPAAAVSNPQAASVDPIEKAPESDAFTFHGKTVDFGELELRTFGNTIHLTVMEAELLRYLIKNDKRVVARKSILEDVWGLHEDTDTRAIDNFVVRLRRYIEEDPSRPRHLLTVRGIGYKFVAEPDGE